MTLLFRTTGLRIGARAILAALIGSLAAGTAGAQTPLERAQAQREVANQQAESETRAAVAQAEKLVRSHPDKAIRDLKAVLRGLDLRTTISTAKREELVKFVQSRIAVLERGGPAPLAATDPRAPVLDAARATRMAENRKHVEKYEAEVKEINEAISSIARDYEANRPKEAERRIAEISRKYPSNPATLYLGMSGSTADRLAAARDIANEQRQRFVIAMNQVQESALPAIRDVEFPKDWKEKTERRRKMQPELYGPEEMKILDTLEQPVNLKFKDAPFEESVQSLSTALNLPIYLDKQSLDDLAVDLKKPVTVPANVSGRTALRAMLQSVGLTFVIKDKVLQVVSVEKSRLNYVTRAYDVSDLVRTGGPFNSPVLWGPFLDYQQTLENARILEDMIRKSIDPLVWQQPGGGSITFHYPSMSMIIRAPSEVHATLGKSLKR